MRRLLPFSPEISASLVVDAAVSVEDFIRFIREAAAAVAKRRAVKGLFGSINAHFGRAAQPVEAGEARETSHLALAERYLSAILINAPDALIATTLDGAVVSWNEAAVRLFGRSWDEVSGRAFQDLFLPEDRDNASDLLDAAGMGRSVRARELRIGGPGGAPMTLELAAGPILGGSGAIEGVSLVARDVTARRRDEVDLRRLNDDLEGRVTEALAERELTAEALRQSQKMEAVGQLTGGVAHDFNNLLTIIRSSVDFLRRPELPEERKKRYLDAVSDTVDRAAKLTGQLLAFARRQSLKPAVFEVGERLRGVADMIDTVTGARIHLVAEIPDEPCFVKADVSQFETALVNMAVNARDAMAGEGTLTLRLLSTGTIPPIRGHAGAKGRFAAISMSDTGAGIAPDVLGRIFEPFFTTKEVGKGTGLGLSQVFGFTKQSGGDIDVRSGLGQGTTFTIYLPEVAQEVPVHPSAASEEPVPLATGQRVLVVEDNIEVGRFATQILEDLGYETTLAANAEEGLECLGEDGAGFRAVFSDVVMPGMGGVELARILRLRLPGLPVILASGYSHVLAQEDDHGFELLHKPYSAEQVGRALRRVMGVP
ncbi:MAG: PAS domain S-box protein [Methylorubrum extorquens]